MMQDMRIPVAMAKVISDPKSRKAIVNMMAKPETRTTIHEIGKDPGCTRYWWMLHSILVDAVQ